MGQWKRKDPERRDGKKYLPRSAWKQKTGGRRPKRRKKKPWRLEHRIINKDILTDKFQLWICRVLGGGTWTSTGKRFFTERSAQDSLLYKCRDKTDLFGVKFEYRIRKIK